MRPGFLTEGGRGGVGGGRVAEGQVEGEEGPEESASVCESSDVKGDWPGGGGMGGLRCPDEDLQEGAGPVNPEPSTQTLKHQP